MLKYCMHFIIFIAFILSNFNLAITDYKWGDKPWWKGGIYTGSPDEQTRNIVYNSSFEFCFDENLPDYWGCPHWGINDPYWVTHYQQWRQNYQIDKTTAHDGKRSMRIHNPNEIRDVNSLSLRSLPLPIPQNETYTLSAWLKSEPAGMKIRMGNISTGKDIILTAKWERYQTAFSNKSNSINDRKIIFHPLSKGTFFIDAVQLEKGEKVTEYVASGTDKMLKQAEAWRLPLRPIVCPNMTDAIIKVDGQLNEPIWKDIPSQTLIPLNGKMSKEPTQFKVLATHNGLYIGIICEQKNAKTALESCKAAKRDSAIWGDSCIEIFFDPGRTEKKYFFLGFNQQGNLYDAVNDGVFFEPWLTGWDWSWDGEWKVATKTEENSWTAEVFVDFCNMNIGNNFNGKIGFNVCRQNHSIKDKEYSSWASVKSSPYRPERPAFQDPRLFGRLQLNKNQLLTSHPLICEKIETIPTVNGKHEIIATVKNNASIPKQVVVQAKVKELFHNNKDDSWDDSSDGFEQDFEKTLNIPNKQVRDIILGVVDVQADAKYAVELKLLCDNKLSTKLQKSFSVCPLLQIRPQYNFCTTESSLPLRVMTNLKKIPHSNYEIEIFVFDMRGEKIKNIKQKLSKETELIRIDIAPLPLGEYHIQVSLLKDEKQIAIANDSFQKLQPEIGAVKIDRFRRCLLNNDKPFIPVGLWWEGKLTKEICEYIFTSGFNSITRHLYSAPWEKLDEITATLDYAAAYEAKVSFVFDCRNNDKIFPFISRLKAEKIFSKFSKHSGLLGWLLFDEKFGIKWGHENYQYINDTFSEIKYADPYHPVFMNENEGGLSMLKKSNIKFPGDIISVDYYCWPGIGSYRPIQSTTKYVKIAEECGRNWGKPVQVVLFNSGYAFWASREFSTKEQEFSTYTSLINGARSIFYFADHPKSNVNWEKIKKLAHEVRELTPALTSLEDIGNISCSSPEIQMLIKRKNNYLYIITVNSSSEKINAKFDLSGCMLPATTRMADVKFEKRSLPITKNVISDQYSGYQRHVYVMDLSEQEWNLPNHETMFSNGNNEISSKSAAKPSAASHIKKILIIGNSITVHGPSTEKLGWPNLWGMAATAKGNDYVHRVYDYICKMQPDEKPQLKISSMLATNMKPKQELLDYGADLVIIQLGENLPDSKATPEKFGIPYRKLVEALKKDKALVFCTSNWWPSENMNRQKKEICEENNRVYFVDLASISTKPESRAKSEGHFKHPAVAAHPGDKGMEMIADAIWEAIKPRLK